MRPGKRTHSYLPYLSTLVYNTSCKRRVRRPPDVGPPLPNVILIGRQPDVFVRRGALQLVHLFSQPLRACQRHNSLYVLKYGLVHGGDAGFQVLSAQR